MILFLSLLFAACGVINCNNKDVLRIYTLDQNAEHEAALLEAGFSTDEVLESREMIKDINTMEERNMLKHIQHTQGLDPKGNFTLPKIQVIPRLYQGDILLTPYQIRRIYRKMIEKQSKELPKASEELARHKRKALNFALFRSEIGGEDVQWSLPIPFSIHPSLNRRTILSGIGQWESTTCIQFQEIDPLLALLTRTPYLIFFPGTGCYSMMGHQSKTRQRLSLGAGCDIPGIIAHEIGHALGLAHEMSRPDRDNYITLNMDNIGRVNSHNFQKLDEEALDLTVPFDFGSIMQYGPNLGANDINNYVIHAKDSLYQFTMGQRHQLSFYDAKGINDAYCPDACSNDTSVAMCLNNGYPDPRNCSKCLCPQGIDGLDCTEPAYESEDCGDQNLEATRDWTTVEFSAKRQMHLCNWLIKTNLPDHAVQLTTTSENILCDTVCFAEFYEIRYKDDFANTGPRFCCADLSEKGIISTTNKVLIRAMLNTGSSLKIKFKAVETLELP